LAGLSWWETVHTSDQLTYADLLLFWLLRLPAAAALVWLAVHASREFALAKRLEEDYGYKSAVAASFMGFHKQMSDMDQAATANSPLEKLCTDTLATIANPPGRIYDKQPLTATPSDEVAGMVGAAASSVAKGMKVS